MFEIGTILKEARLHRRIDLVEAEQDTKIRSKYLAALETEDFDVLPGPVFVRGFLRTYTRYLGLDPQTFVDEYNARFGQFEELEDSPVLGRPGLAHERGRRRMSAMRLFLVASLLALAGIIWLGLRSSDEPAAQSRTTPSVQSPTEDTPPTSATRESSTRTSVAPRRPAAPAAPTVARLTIRAVGGPAWVEVRAGNSSGKVVYSGEIAEGSLQRVNGKRLYLTAGAPSQTLLQLGGRSTRGSGSGPASWIITPTRVVATA